ncbi:MAG: hypothetical protein ACC707_08690 [Thiohalomonadales bacterium]
MSRKIKSVFAASLFAILPMAPVQAVEFGLFGDVSVNDSDVKGENSAFALGGLDFYATQAISDTTRGFVEFVLENTPDGIVTDLERLWISHTFKDEITLAGGRFHTPLGSWNRTYHHGAILQDTVSRPFFLDFEDGDAGILPVHAVGLMATGDFALENSEISYELAVGNGPSIDTSSAGLNANPDDKPEIDINNISDPNGNKSIALRGIYKPDALPIKVGLFMMDNTIAESSDGTGNAAAATGDTLVSQLILGFDVGYTYEDFDLMAEYYNFDNKNEVGSDGSHSATAYFLQLGYQINDTFKAVVRYEDLDFDTNDSYFRLLGTQKASHNVFALRYDVDESNALKFEVNQKNLDLAEDSTSYRLQWAFLIP